MQRKHVVFMGVIITVIVMSLTANGKTFANYHPAEQRTHRSVLIFCTPASGLPIGNKNEGSDYYFRATPSFNGQSNNNGIQFYSEAGLLFELFLKGFSTHTSILVHPLIADNALLMTLFSVIISPNAP